MIQSWLIVVISTRMDDISKVGALMTQSWVIVVICMDDISKDEAQLLVLNVLGTTCPNFQFMTTFTATIFTVICILKCLDLIIINTLY